MAGPLKHGDPFLWACVQATGAIVLCLGSVVLVGWLVGAIK